MKRLSRRQFNTRLTMAGVALTVPGWGHAQSPEPIGPAVFTFAGTGVAGSEVEISGALAVRSPINNPYGIVSGPDGAMYFCEVDSGRIRRISLLSNRLNTIAGNGEKGFQAESRNPLETPFSAPHEIRWDDSNSLYVVERDSHSVRRIAGESGLVTTLAGDGNPGFKGDDRSAVLSQLRQPHSIAFDSRGNLLICDTGNSRLRLVSRETGIITTASGTGESIATPESGAMTDTPLLGPRSLDTDPDGNIYLVLREGNAVYQLNPKANTLSRLAGTGATGYSGDGGSALDATFNGPKGIAYSRGDNSLYIVDTENHAVRKIKLATGIIETVLGTGEKGDGPEGDPALCKLNRPHGVCVFRQVLYVTDSENHRIRAVTGLFG
jgi:DNA-binding beta-propeller fold protein YncE